MFKKSKKKRVVSNNKRFIIKLDNFRDEIVLIDIM